MVKISNENFSDRPGETRIHEYRRNRNLALKRIIHYLKVNVIFFYDAFLEIHKNLENSFLMHDWLIDLNLNFAKLASYTTAYFYLQIRWYFSNLCKIRRYYDNCVISFFFRTNTHYWNWYWFSHRKSNYNWVTFKLKIML